MSFRDPMPQRIRQACGQLLAESHNDIRKMLLWTIEDKKKHATSLVHWEHADEIFDLSPNEKTYGNTRNGTNHN